MGEGGNGTEGLKSKYMGCLFSTCRKPTYEKLSDFVEGRCKSHSLSDTGEGKKATELNSSIDKEY